MHVPHLPRVAGLVLVVMLGAGCDFVVRASVSIGGGDTDGGSFDPSISGDGRHVAFMSPAGNLVPGDGNGLTVS